MLRFLKSLFADPTADWNRVVNDPDLGELRLNQDATWWDAAVTIDGRVIRFAIGGEVSPSPALLDRARVIIRDFAGFRATLSAFLEAEATRHPEWADEIRQLAMDTISLFWPDRPDEGEITFAGSREDRLWSCAMSGQRLYNLGYD